MSDLLSVAQAQERLLSEFSPLHTEMISLMDAAGRLLAVPISAGLNLPPFANSSMDGFALRAEDVGKANPQNPVRLEVVADIPAGTMSDIQLAPGQTARIMTGAPLPVGADAIVPVEQTDFHNRMAGIAAPEHVLIYSAVMPGDYVRPPGQDVSLGEQLFKAGARLRPQDVGLLAMLGAAQVAVYRRPRVAVFSTGDELTPVDQKLTSGMIHDLNGYILVSMLRKLGAEAVYLGIVPDRAEAVQAGLDRAVDLKVDLIVTSAGVSVGAFDYVRSVVEQKGSLHFWRVNMRPGKPLAFGAYGGIPFFGLPGNPVSAFVGFEVFVRPALYRMMGYAQVFPVLHTTRLLEAVESDGRESYLRAQVESLGSGWGAKLTGHQGSGNLRSLVQANALLLVPSGVKSLPSGSEVNFWFLD